VAGDGLHRDLGLDRIDVESTPADDLWPAASTIRQVDVVRDGRFSDVLGVIPSSLTDAGRIDQLKRVTGFGRFPTQKTSV
jgi:hypothetical protein